MEALSVRDYRNNLAASFDRADKGEPVIIRRRGQLFALTSLGKEDVSISPRLQKHIDEARKAFRNGECISCKTPKDLTDYLDSL
ncbi:MAG: type II toxin-antitoxin system Phd/YefM family antitoxin [Bacteroides sp.]|nr:type II toxin-antitoxin system Phd/YefM family antitoxin [Bacteroides sp.]